MEMDTGMPGGIQQNQEYTDFRSRSLLPSEMHYSHHVCETINNKQTMFAFLANRRRKNIERGRGASLKVWD